MLQTRRSAMKREIQNSETRRHDGGESQERRKLQFAALILFGVIATAYGGAMSKDIDEMQTVYVWVPVAKADSETCMSMEKLKEMLRRRNILVGDGIVVCGGKSI